MSRRRFRLPSPALVLSMVALSIVLGGTAVAATTTHSDAKADTKLVKKLAPSLSVKNAKQLGGVAAGAYERKVQWALVSKTGTTILAQSGGISVASHAAAGEFYLHFPTTVAGHAISLTGAYGASHEGYPPVQIEGSPCGASTPDSTTCFATGTNIPSDLFVSVNDDTGTQVDRPFYVVVYP